MRERKWGGGFLLHGPRAKCAKNCFYAKQGKIAKGIQPPFLSRRDQLIELLFATSSSAWGVKATRVQSPDF